MPRKKEEYEGIDLEVSVSDSEKIRCCGKEFTKDELYWHKRKCH